MEFPNLGSHCDVSNCRKLGKWDFCFYCLDFLPLCCSGCRGVFCKDHFYYSQHNCTNSYLHDNQVPVCPLCGVPVPVRPGELPDFRVGNHIDTACQSKPARELKGKLFNNSCCVRSCKKKEVVPFICSVCDNNFCIAHRNELDHNCKELQLVKKSNLRRISQVGAAAVFKAVFLDSRFRNQSKSSTSKDMSKLRQEEDDRQLALALAASCAENKSSHSSNNSYLGSNHSCNIT